LEDGLLIMKPAAARMAGADRRITRAKAMSPQTVSPKVPVRDAQRRLSPRHREEAALFTCSRRRPRETGDDAGLPYGQVFTLERRRPGLRIR
jgi:hypothetical protein